MARYTNSELDFIEKFLSEFGDNDSTLQIKDKIQKYRDEIISEALEDKYGGRLVKIVDKSNPNQIFIGLACHIKIINSNLLVKSNYYITGAYKKDNPNILRYIAFINREDLTDKSFNIHSDIQEITRDEFEDCVANGLKNIKEINKEE